MVAVFHDRMLPALDNLSSKRPVGPASSKHIGAAIAEVLKPWGYEPVFASAKNRSRAVLAELAKRLEQGRIVLITPDGSRGPRHVMKPGAVLLARKACVPLYLVCPDYRGFRIPFSWDRFFIPYPFTRVSFRSVRIDFEARLSKGELAQKLEQAQAEMQAMYGTD